MSASVPHGAKGEAIESRFQEIVLMGRWSRRRPRGTYPPARIKQRAVFRFDVMDAYQRARQAVYLLRDATFAEHLPTDHFVRGTCGGDRHPSVLPNLLLQIPKSVSLALWKKCDDTGVLTGACESGEAFRAAQRQRLLAFALTILGSTCVSWEVMLSSWTAGPRPYRILGDAPFLVGGAICHGVAALSRYFVSSAASSTESVPSVFQSTATVLVHVLAGMPSGLFMWYVLLRRTGSTFAPRLAEGSGVLGALIACGGACGVLYALYFVLARKHQLRFDSPGSRTSRSFLMREVADSLKRGLSSGVLLAVLYLVFRCLSELLAGNRAGRALAFTIGLRVIPRTDAVIHEAGKLLVAYLVFLSAVIHVALQSFLGEVMNSIIAAPQDFVGLWHASIGTGGAGGGDATSAGPGSPAAMLLDALSLGHGPVLHAAEQDFLRERGGGSAGGAAPRGCVYKPGSIGDWTEEIELQRRALAIAAMAAASDPATATAVLDPQASSSAGRGRGQSHPLWAQVAKVQALQSLALKAPRDQNLRAALYKINTPQLLRTLCLELDTAGLLLQGFAFQRDHIAAERALGCERRGDVRWLARQLPCSSPQSSLGDVYQRLVEALREGFTPPFRDSLFSFLLHPSRQGNPQDCGTNKAPALGKTRAQSALWATQGDLFAPSWTPVLQSLLEDYMQFVTGMVLQRLQAGISALMVNAPGESLVWSLDALLPVVLGSLAGLLLAVQRLSAEAVTGAGIDEDTNGQLFDGQGALAHELENALSSIAGKYRPCLADFRLPLAYAEIVNRLC